LRHLFFRPDDVLQTVKFGEDVLQQMRTKRNEIISSHATSSKPSESKIVKQANQNKVITPTAKMSESTVDKVKEHEERLSKVGEEFDTKLNHLQNDMTLMMSQQKSELEIKMKEIIINETTELRKEFKQDREEQVNEKN